MSLQQTDDPVKSQLLKKAATRKDEIEEEFKSISKKTEKVLTTALVAGAVLALTYYAVSELSGKKKSKKKKIKKDEESVEASVDYSDDAPSLMSTIGTALASQALVYLLDIGKEKLEEYLGRQKNENS